MASTVILTLRWDDEGEAKINFAGMDKLYGIEKADFLDDVIGMLNEYRCNTENDWAEDYLNASNLTEADKTLMRS